VKQEEEIISDVSSLLGVPQGKILEELQKRLLKVKELEKKLNSQRFDTLKSSVDDAINKNEQLSGINFISHIESDANSVRRAVDLIKEKVRQNAVVFVSTGANLETRYSLLSGSPKTWWKRA